MSFRTAATPLSIVPVLVFVAAGPAQINSGYTLNPLLQFQPMVSYASGLTLQLVPPATITSISAVLEEAGEDLDIVGTGFLAFLPRSSFFGTFTPMVKFGVATGTQASASYTVVSDTLIRVASIPASAVTGKVMLVYRRDMSWTPTPEWITVAQSPLSFALGTKIRIENSDPARFLDYVSIAHGPTSTVIIDPMQPDPARRLLTPFNNSGSISPRVLVPANVASSVSYSFTGSASVLALPGTVTFPGGARWRLTVPGGQLVLVL